MRQSDAIEQRPLSLGVSILLGACALGVLYAGKRYSYLLYHSLAELFSVVVACGIFMLAWNARRFIRNGYLLLLGIAYLFVGGLDLVHTLAYTGMCVFHALSTNEPTQLWIGARYPESLSLLAAPLFFTRRLNVRLALLTYTGIVVALLGSVFVWHIFPDCFVAGTGLTAFKVNSEFVICGILLGAGALAWVHRERFERRVLWLVEASIGVTIGSELLFTAYRAPYGPANMGGHFFKIVSFYLIYKAIIETGLVKPYGLLFRELKQSETALLEARESLERRVRQRTAELEDQVLKRIGAEQRLRNANELLESAFSNIHILIASMDAEFNYLRVNQAFAEAHGAEPQSLVGRNHFDLYPRWGAEEVFRRVRETGRPHFAFEEPIEAGDGEHEDPRYWDWSLQAVPGPGGWPGGFVLCMVDATARKRAQEALRKNEERFRLLAENARDIIFRWRARPRLAVEYISAATSAILGYAPEEFYADPDLLLRTVHPDDREALERQLVESEGASGPTVVRWRHKDGNIVWTEQTLVPMRDAHGAVVAVEGIARDITERKKAEHRIVTYQRQLRSLASELLLAEERERRRIAADLHDGVCQALAAAKIKIGVLGRDGLTHQAQEALREVRELIDQSLRETRSLMFEISPPVLYELGLEAAIEWLCDRFERRYGIRAEFVNDGEPRRLDEEMRVILFRAVRELLINVVKHARAHRATVSLENVDGGVRITVEDDGRGFDVSNLEHHTGGKGGFGLFNIRERLEHLGGEGIVESRIGQGTRVILTAPLREPTETSADRRAANDD